MMKKMYKKLAARTSELRTQLFWAYFLVFALFFAAVLALGGFAIRDFVTDQIGRNRTDVLRQIAERADIVKTSSITLSNLYSHEIQSNDFLSKGMTPGEQAEASRYLDAQKQIYNVVFEHIGLGYEAVLLGDNGFDYYSDESRVDLDSLKQQPWYRHLRTALNNAPVGTVEFSRTFKNDTANGPVYQFAAGRLLETGDGQSVLLILIDEHLLETLYATTQEQGGEIYMYDQNGFIVSHSNKKMLGKQFIDVGYMKDTFGVNSSNIIKKLGSRYMISTYLDEEIGWTIVEEIPTAVIFDTLNKAYFMMGTILVIALALAVAVSVYMSRRISNPLTELSDAMDNFGSCDITPLSAATGTQEIDHLRRSFHHMAVEISRLMDVIQEREQQKRVLEVNFLRAQINPHFLYNMLFSIRCAVEVGKSAQATQMLGAFIDLLRSTLAVKDTTVALCDELETTRKYLVVQKLRYGEKVNYEIEMQEGSEHCMVPPLILQPLVENAIFHGLEAKEDAGMVVIEAALQGDDLLLTVTDDGAGMDPETLERVRACCELPVVKDARSIGMSNVHNRIRLNYGEGYGLSVESSQGVGTTITLLMPAVFGKEEKDESSDRG